MSDTQTQQVRTAVTVSGVEKFKVEITVLDKGDLPDIYLFVVEIIDETDPKEDSFARVTNIADFDELEIDRPTAVTTNATYYRVGTYVFYYDDLETAVNAQDVLKSRIDELVEDWQTYQGQFVTVAEVTDHPRLDASTYEAAVEAYTDARDAEAEALTTRDEALEAYTDATTTAADAAADVTAAQTRYDKCVEAKSWHDALYSALNAFITANQTFQGIPGPFREASALFYSQAGDFITAADIYRAATDGVASAPDKAAYDTAKGIYSGASGVYGSKPAAFQNAIDLWNNGITAAVEAKAASDAHSYTFCQYLSNELDVAETAKETADTEVSTTRTSYEDAQTAYESAQAATEAALAAVVAMKPDFDPTSV